MVQQDGNIVHTSNIYLADGPVVVGWRSSDLNLFTPRAAPAIFPASPTPWTTDPSPSSSISSPPRTTSHNRNAAKPTVTHPSSNGLSTGAKAGIGVGVSIACLAAITAVILFLIFRRRRASGTSSRVVANRTRTLMSEADSRSKPAEVHAHSRPVEADSIARSELDSGWQGVEVRGAAARW